MKKYLYFLIFILLSFISIIKVNALIDYTSGTSILYGQFTSDANTHLEWLYSTSDDYLFSYIEDYEYKTISVYVNNYTYNGYSSIIIGINIFGNNNNVGIISQRSSDGTKGNFVINGSTDRFLQYYIYYNPNNNKYYREYNFINEVTELTDNERTRNIGQSGNIDLWNFSGYTQPINQNFTPYQIYYTNMSFSTISRFRPFELYNENDLKIGTYNQGDNVPCWRTYYHPFPTYLNGYKKINLTIHDRYVMISDVSSGSVYIPADAFYNYGGRLSYYDKDIESQPYTSYIENYTPTIDGNYIRQDFNLSSYSGADWVMFSKYIYLDGEDDISYFIWVPDTSYDSNVIITPNNQGGNDFDFTYKDNNGNIQDGSYSSIDLDITAINPLLGSIFSDFSTNYFGISSIITAPLSLINQLSTSTCSPLILPFPYSDVNLTLPCMSEIYEENFGELFDLYQFLLLGFISYRIGVSIFYDIKKLKDPNNDEVEVINL